MTKTRTSRSAFEVACIAGAAGAICIATLTPAPDWPGVHLRFLASLRFSGVDAWLDVAANVVLYLPLGLALSLPDRPRWRASFGGAGLSAATELLQFYVPGRDPSARDIIANAAGAYLGALVLATALGPFLQRGVGTLERWTDRLLQADGRLAGTYSFVWAMVTAAVLVCTAVLLSPAPPNGDRYFVRGPFFDRATGPLRIGGGGEGSGFFQGLIDDVRIFDRPRSADAIRQDMAQPVIATLASTPGLVAAYGFDAARGPLAHDDSGQLHDGEIRGASWVDRGRFGGALSFDGHSNEVVVPTAPSLNLTDGMTLEAWVFPIGQPAEWPGIVTHESYFLDASSIAGRYLAATGGLLGSSEEHARLVDPMPEGKWTHLAGTYDGQTISLYANGNLAGSNQWWSAHQQARVSLNGRSLPFGAVVNGRELGSLLTSDLALQATVTCGASRSAVAPLFFLWAPGDVNVISLLSEGDDLLLRSSTWARRLLLLSPDSRVPGAFRHCPTGQKMEVALAGRLQDVRADLDGHRVPVEAPSVGSGWAFLIHSELLSGWLRVGFTAAWLALLSFPFGFWMRRTQPTLLGAAVLVVAFQLVPRLWHLPPLDVAEIAAICAGLLLGGTGQVYARRGRVLV